MRCFITPAKIGDTVYHITTCKYFPRVLDGTMYDADGGHGTATGLYCPCELMENCPFPCDDDGDFDCDKHKNTLAIFEDIVDSIRIEDMEDYIAFNYSGGADFGDIGKTVFLTREEAEAALEEMKMAEYIERAAVLKSLGYEEKRRSDVLPGSTFDIILKEPASDVAPVVHGKWVKAHWKNSVSCANCSVCGFEAYHYDFQGVQKTYDYCPSCGARMDLDTADDVQSIYEAALNKWGKENQTRMMFEEMAELQKELCKEARGEDNTDAIAEEIADVKIMLEQMIILHNCKDMVEMQMKRKLQRLKKRLEGE